jgi:hypothetical protein
MDFPLSLGLNTGEVSLPMPVRRSNKAAVSKGDLVAKTLSGAWRLTPPSLTDPVSTTGRQFSDRELAKVAPLLLKSGGAALGWWRIRNSGLQATQTGGELHQAYRLHSLHAALKMQEVCQVFSYLRSKGLEPLLGKGWAIARHYPELGLRPYGDIDLYVSQEQYGTFNTLLKEMESRGWQVDLHRGAAELDDRSYETLYARSQLSRLGEVEVRTFGPEDHLRLLCLHFLREGALRPLWLCDIAVALETLPPGFDWEYFLCGNERRTEWAASAIGLAHQLLGAEMDGLLIAGRVERMPRWLVPSVLKQWGAGKIIKGSRAPMSGHLRSPKGMLNSLRQRWPNPIEATVGVKGPFNNWPRLPFQLGECALRTVKFALQIPKLLRATN